MERKRHLKKHVKIVVITIAIVSMLLSLYTSAIVENGIVLDNLRPIESTILTIIFIASSGLLIYDLEGFK